MHKFFGGKLAIWIFAFPALLLFSVFVIYPLFPAIYISFSEHDGFKNFGFVGFANYKALLTSGIFWLVNKNTLLMVVIQVIFGVTLSLALALILDLQTPAIRRFFKTAAFIPAIISVTVVGQMWLAIYEPNWGMLNSFLRAVGLGSFAKSWLTDASTVMGSITVAFLWQYLGMNMVILYTGLKTIPKMYYEAALIDGASFWQTSIKITIPLMQDIIKYLLIISCLGVMGQFGHVSILTGGGPGDISRSIIYELYNLAFQQSDYGQACALSILFIIECLMIVILINKTVAKEKIQF